ncbi:MAG: OmpA family protein [Paludibacter sp.]|nr:OmpA family protein [Paludibacter sp.]
MEPLIRIHGKSQSRTALGIINAYLKLHPDSTLSDLREAFPKSLNPRGIGEYLIVPVKEALKHEKQYFEQDDELIVLKSGQKLALLEIWQKEDYDAICEHAKQYGIEVAEMQKTDSFEKGSYRLEYLNDFVPPEEVAPQTKKKRKCRWWWLLLLLLLLLILLFCFKKCGWCGDKTKCDVPTASVVGVNPTDSLNLVKDLGDNISLTLSDGSVLNFPKNSSEYKLISLLNSDSANLDESVIMDRLGFETGKAELKPESEEQLKNVAAILSTFPNAAIKMCGYSDNTGSDKVNLRVSTQRAKIAADKLIGLGVEASRVTSEGFGSQNPVCPQNDTDNCKAQNRRVDIKVIKK